MYLNVQWAPVTTRSIFSNIQTYLAQEGQKCDVFSSLWCYNIVSDSVIAAHDIIMMRLQ